MHSILVADDHAIVREGLKRVLEAEPDLSVCGEARDGREVLEQVEKHRPDCVVLDISMPRLGGLEALERIRTRQPDVRVVLLSAHGNGPFVQSAVALGAEGYVLKDGGAAEVVGAVRAVLEGGSYFSPPVAKQVLSQLRAPEPQDPFQLLSCREREVLHLIAEGLSAKEVAVQLDVSTKTVEAHRTSLMRKVGARKATELVRYAVRHGLLKA